MPKILVSGSLAYDRIMDFPGLFKDHFLPDKLHNLNISFNVESLEEHFGGTAGNIAYNLALLGKKPTILSNAGSDFKKYAEHLDKQGILLESIPLIQDQLTSSAFIITDMGDNQITAFHMGAGGKAYASAIDFAPTDLLIAGAGNLTDMEVFPKMAKQVGATYFFDPGQAIPSLSSDALRAGLEGAHVLFGNDYELSMISKKTMWSEADLLLRVPTLVITLGEQGTRIVTKEGERAVKVVPVAHVVDPTGAGDAYRAGFIVGFLAKRPLRESVQLASTVAAYAIEHVGTQNHTFTMDELKARYQAAYGEALEI